MFRKQQFIIKKIKKEGSKFKSWKLEVKDKTAYSKVKLALDGLKIKKQISG